VRRTPALIVGGGPAGAAAAIALARAGAAPCLIERTPGPHDVVCGGFLGWDALALLDRLGLDPLALGARPIRTLRLVSRERSVEVRLPRVAAGLSRRRLDEALLALAGKSGASVRRGQTVRAVDLAGRTARLDGGEEFGAECLFLATGKHELRGASRDVPRNWPEGAVGLRVALEADAAIDAMLTGTLELHLFDGGYAGLLIQEDGSVNLCLSVAGPKLGGGNGLEGLLGALAKDHPALRPWLERRRAGPWAAISGVPYGWRASMSPAGVFRVGDQAAVIASLAGDGIAIALKSGLLAAAAMAEGGAAGAGEFQRRFARDAPLPLKVAGMLRWAAEHGAPRRPLMTLIDAAPGLARLAARLTRIG
jgi:flavin-dependent dehydrogenase